MYEEAYAVSLAARAIVFNNLEFFHGKQYDKSCREGRLYYVVLCGTNHEPEDCAR